MRRTFRRLAVLALLLSMLGVAPARAMPSSTVGVGSYPVGLALDPVSHDVFVGHGFGMEIKRIDPVARTSSTFGPANSWSPNHLAVDAESGRIYVASQSAVEVLALSDGHLIASMSVPPGPRGVVLANGKLFVANNSAASVSIFDTDTLDELARIPVGARPLGVAADEARGLVFVASAFGNSVSVIDAATDQVVHVLSVPTPNDVAVDPASARLFVAGQSAGLYAFDTDTFTLVGIASYATDQGNGCCASNVTFAPETGRVYISGPFGKLEVFNASTLQMLSLEPVGSDPHSVVTDPVTWEVFVANAGDDTVSILRQDTTSPTVRAAATPGGPEVTHDGEQMARNWHVDFTCSDSQSGCARTLYSVDGGADVSGSALDLTQTGTHTITYRAIDNARNVSDAGHLTLAVDATPPVTAGTSQASASGSSGWTRGTWTLELSCTDPAAGASSGASGCARTSYEIDRNTTQDYFAPIVVDSEGRHTVSARSFDLVGNVEGDVQFPLNIDRSEPEVEMERTQGILFASPVLPTELHAVAADPLLVDGSAGSGVEAVCFAITRTAPSTENLGCIEAVAQGALWSASPELDPGAYEVTPRARDRANNPATGPTIAIVVAA